MLIGPPGSGKTTALVNSGLKFPSGRRLPGRGRRRRRHPLLRLVVHRGRRPDRHRGALHDAELRRQSRPEKLARLPRSSEEEQAAPADQRRARRDQHRGFADAAAGRGRRARRRDQGAPRRTARTAEGQFSGLCPVHQSRPRHGFMEFFGDLDEQRRAQVFGATFQTMDKTRKSMLAHAPAEFEALTLPRRGWRATGSGSRPREPRPAVRLPGADGRPARPGDRLPQRHLRSRPLPDQGGAARLLFHLGHAGGDADRSVARRARQGLRRRSGQRRPIRDRARAFSSPISSARSSSARPAGSADGAAVRPGGCSHGLFIALAPLLAGAWWLGYARNLERIATRRRRREIRRRGRRLARRPGLATAT